MTTDPENTVYGRCEATAKSSGKRCGRAAVGDHGKCKIHGGGSKKGEESPQFKDGTWSKYAGLDDDVTRDVQAIENEIKYLEEMRDERMARYYQALKHLAENEGTEVAMKIIDQIEEGQGVDPRLVGDLARVINASSQGMDRLVARIQELTNDIIEAKGEHPEKFEVEHSYDDDQFQELREDIASAYGGDDADDPDPDTSDTED